MPGSILATHKGRFVGSNYAWLKGKQLIVRKAMKNHLIKTHFPREKLESSH